MNLAYSASKTVEEPRTNQSTCLAGAEAGKFRYSSFPAGSLRRPSRRSSGFSLIGLAGGWRLPLESTGRL